MVRVCMQLAISMQAMAWSFMTIFIFLQQVKLLQAFVLLLAYMLLYLVADLLL